MALGGLMLTVEQERDLADLLLETRPSLLSAPMLELMVTVALRGADRVGYERQAEKHRASCDLSHGFDPGGAA